jgi:urease subunit beta
VRPGEILPADGPVPTAPAGRTETVRVTNRGRFAAYLTSHFPVARASGALAFDRDDLDGARPALPAGASVRIPAGETIELELTWS